MATMSHERMAQILQPYLKDVAEKTGLIKALTSYLDLLLRWNARTNLTAIREPEEIVRRHFGESLFLGQILKGRLTSTASLLDFGSGAGFPGLPIQLLLPDLHVTLAESQRKKASFLHEAVRTLDLRTEVWDGRVEAMEPGRQFDVVTMRAVDETPEMLLLAAQRVKAGGALAALGGEALKRLLGDASSIAIPGTERSWVLVKQF